MNIQAPTVQVEIDGQALPAKARLRLEEIVVAHRLSQPSQCELSFVMPDLAAWPAAGMPLRLSEEDGGELFSGEIAAVEYSYRASGERLLHVRAYDRLLALRRRQTLRAWTDSSAGAIARELAGSIGVSVAEDAKGPAYRTLIQSGASDLDFLAEVAARSGLYFSLHGEILHLLALDGVGDETMLRTGDTLLEATVEMNDSFASGPVKNVAWDAGRLERRPGEAAQARNRETAAGSASGAGASLPLTLANGNACDEDASNGAAQAELDRRVARSRSIRGTADGNADLLPGVPIRVVGLPPALPSRFTLTEVKHRFNAQCGFVSEFTSLPPAPASPPRDAASLAWGIVSDIQDPDKMGRVRVTLPSVGDVETGWLEVTAIGAGKGKGFVNQPDAGDQVVVLFPRGDLGSGLVLGGLYGADGPGDYGVEDKVVRYALLTPGGHKLRFDDTRKSLRIEDATGSRLEFTPQGASLHSAVDLSIEAPGRALVMSAKTIDFRRA